MYCTLTEGFLTLTEVFLTLTEVFLTLTEGFLTLTEVFLTLTEGFLTLTEVFLTLTEVSPCLFLRCRANARVKLAKTGHGPHSSTLVVFRVVRLYFVLFYVLLVCKYVMNYCHRVTTQLQLTNISYHIYMESFEMWCWKRMKKIS